MVCLSRLARSQLLYDDVCVCACMSCTHTHDSLCTNVCRCNDSYIIYIYIYIHMYIQYILIYIYISHTYKQYICIYIYYTSYIKRLLLFGYLPFFDVLFPLSWRKALVDEGWSWIYIIHMLYSIALVMVVRTPVILGYTVQRYTEYILCICIYKYDEISAAHLDMDSQTT
jgi:hypothetical protein